MKGCGGGVGVGIEQMDTADSGSACLVRRRPRGGSPEMWPWSGRGSEVEHAAPAKVRARRGDGVCVHCQRCSDM